VDARVLSGVEEARLTFRGALSGLTSRSPHDEAVFDIGGGSTEIVMGGSVDPFPLSFAESFDIGSVRLTERHICNDPPHAHELEDVTRVAREALGSVPPLPEGTTPVGVAGTMTTLAAVSLGLVPYDGARVHGHVMSRAALAETVQSLAAMDLARRREARGIEPKRADVIVAGGLIALELLHRWRAESVRISDRGVRWGLAEDLSC
jgi:exopolyphosphatase/guanosine-5'-triphosphate,3'-diphosphate pyrophosphatase